MQVSDLEKMSGGERDSNLDSSSRFLVLSS